MAKASTRLGRGLGSLIAGGTKSKQESESEISLPLEQDPIPEKKELNKQTKGIYQQASEELSEVPLDNIVPNPYQPRKVIEPSAISDLAASIQSEGLLQPIVVRKVGDQFELVAGERRWRAHQHLGRDKILVRVLSASDISSASLSLIENLQREGLNPIEEAMGYNSLVNEFNLTQAKVAERVGKSRVHVTNSIRILQLDDDLQHLLSSQKLGLGHAKVLLGIDDLGVRNQLGKKAAEEGWTVRQCERAVSEFRNPGVIEVKNSQRPNPYSNFAKVAESSLKRRISIQTDTLGKGKLSLHFSNETDLINLLEKLGVPIK